MLTLTYSLPNDEFQTVTLLGDGKGIWDLWWRLTNGEPKNANDGVGKITIRDCHGRVVDAQKGMTAILQHDAPLSRLD